MITARAFTKEISMVKAALSQAERIAGYGGYPQVDFRSLIQRLHALDNAVYNKNVAAVVEAMNSINSRNGGNSELGSGNTVVRRVEPIVKIVGLENLKVARVKAGRKGGHSCSPAKRAAARMNGKRGGRPKKVGTETPKGQLTTKGKALRTK